MLCVHVAWTDRLNRLSDLMTIQLGFWLQEQKGVGAPVLSHGVLHEGCQGGTSGVDTVFPVLFPHKSTDWGFLFPKNIQTVKGTELPWYLLSLNCTLCKCVHLQLLLLILYSNTLQMFNFSHDINYRARIEKLFTLNFKNVILISFSHYRLLLWVTAHKVPVILLDQLQLIGNYS